MRTRNLNEFKTNIRVNECVEGERIETTVKRLLTTNEEIPASVKVIYTERKNGVEPQYNIRTDRFEIAQNAMSICDKANKAKREKGIKEREPKPVEDNKSKTPDIDSSVG